MNILKKVSLSMSAFSLLFISAMNTGCASGGYKLTRQYAGWVNSQHIVVRIILYLLTGIVYAITLLVDSVVFNTMDFWQGKVSQGTFEFKDQEKSFVAVHSYREGRKHSEIKVYDLSKKLLQTVEFSENVKGEIELYVDSTLRGVAKNIDSLPEVVQYNTQGEVVNSQFAVSEVLLTKK